MCVSGQCTIFSKICHHIPTVYGKFWSRFMCSIQWQQLTYSKIAKHQRTSKIWKFLRSLSNIGIALSHYTSYEIDFSSNCWCDHQGRRYTEQPMSYEGLPDILPSGEYRVNLTTYSYIDGKRRDLLRTLYLGELKTTTAEQWRR